MSIWSYSQLGALLEIPISPVFMQIQHQVELNPVEMNLLFSVISGRSLE